MDRTALNALLDEVVSEMWKAHNRYSDFMDEKAFGRKRALDLMRLELERLVAKGARGAFLLLIQTWEDRELRARDRRGEEARGEAQAYADMASRLREVLRLREPTPGALTIAGHTQAYRDEQDTLLLETLRPEDLTARLARNRLIERGKGSSRGTALERMSSPDEGFDEVIRWTVREGGLHPAELVKLSEHVAERARRVPGLVRKVPGNTLYVLGQRWLQQSPEIDAPDAYDPEEFFIELFGIMLQESRLTGEHLEPKRSRSRQAKRTGRRSSGRNTQLERCPAPGNVGTCRCGGACSRCGARGMG